MFYTSAWCLNGEERFRENIPLVALGDSLLRFHSKKRIKVLLLEGFKNLSENYLRELSRRNIDIIDFTKEFIDIIERYPNLNAHYSHYERNCFLRWIAFKDYRKKHDAGQFWHLDGDMALFVSLDELAERTNGMTFMTLGCPCFLTVSQEGWFSTYEKELKKLDANVEAYLENGGITKEECRANDHKKFNQSLYREPLGSDQDFLEYLISSGKIFQEDVRKIINSNFYYIQNPLSFFQMDAYMSSEIARVESDTEGHLIYKGLKIPFIHYQSGFYYFCVVASHMGGARPFLRLLLRRNIKENATEISMVGIYLWKVFREISPTRFSRNNMTNIFSSKNTQGEIKIVEIMNKLISIF
jgi:hypothetical protein